MDFTDLDEFVAEEMAKPKRQQDSRVITMLLRAAAQRGAEGEREECAKACEGMDEYFADNINNGAGVAAMVCADIIRARSNVEVSRATHHNTEKER